MNWPKHVVWYWLEYTFFIPTGCAIDHPSSYIFPLSHPLCILSLLYTPSFLEHGCTYVDIETAKMWATLWMRCSTEHPDQVIDSPLEAESRSAGQVFPLLGTPNVYWRVLRISQVELIIRSTNPCHPLWLCFVVIHFNIILLCTLEVSNRLWGTSSFLFSVVTGRSFTQW